MNVGNFLAVVRFDIGDTPKTKYSDYEFIDALNSVLRIVSNNLIKLKSDLITTTADLNLVGGSSPLPSDFISVVSVEANGEELLPLSGYKIIQTTLYSKLSKVRLVYRYSFPVLKGLDDEIPIPYWFVEHLKKFVIMVITKQISKSDSSLSDMIYRDLTTVASGREFSIIERENPFYV